LPEVLRYVAGDIQNLTGGRIDAAILRQLLIALAMIAIMLMRPRGLWPTPEHGRSAQGDGGTGSSAGGAAGATPSTGGSATGGRS